MTLRRVVLALLFGGVFIIGLISFAPASLMGYALQRASGGKLLLAQTSGSLWQGSGVVVLKQKSRFQTLGSYRWKFDVIGRALQVREGDAAPMTLRYAPLSGRVDIERLHLTLPASIMELAAPQLVPYQFQGMLDAASEHLTLEAGGVNGQVEVDWKNAASGLSRIRPLGDYRIVLQARGSAADAKLSTRSGKLLLNGTGSFDGVNGMRLDGTAQAAPGTTELDELLHHIGPEVSLGVYKLSLMPQPGAR